jgi:hypothetical protein
MLLPIRLGANILNCIIRVGANEFAAIDESRKIALSAEL